MYKEIKLKSSLISVIAKKIQNFMRKQKVIGKVKDETEVGAIVEFVGLKSRCTHT